MERLSFIRTKVERPAAGLLAIGLLAAIVAADDLPRMWSTTLFAVLLVLDAITISWLTRPCDDHRPSAPNARHNGRAVGGSFSARCGSAR